MGDDFQKDFVSCGVCGTRAHPMIMVEVHGVHTCSTECGDAINDAFMQEQWDEQHQAEMRELERQEMECHFTKHPHG